MLLCTSNDHLKLKIQVLTTSIEEAKSKLQACIEDKSFLITETQKIEQSNSLLDSRIRDLAYIVNKLSEKHSKLKKSVESNKEYEKEIIEKLALHIQLENEMAAELLKYRGIVAEAKSTYQKFYVKRIWMVMTTNVTLILQKGPDGKHVFQIHDGQKMVTYKISEFDAVYMHPVKLNRFFIRIFGDDDQEYESENAEKIMGLIRELIFSDFNERD